MAVRTPSRRRAGTDAERPAWLAVDWGSHVHRAVLEGATVNYAELGAGSDEPPLLLIHGLGGCWQNWLPNLPELAERRRVIALDLPGFGASPLPDWKLGVEGYAAHLDGFLEAKGIERAAVCGHSMGGLISVEMARTFPERVAKLALVSPAGYGHASIPARRLLWLARAGFAVEHLTSRVGPRSFRRPRMRTNLFPLSFHRPEEVPPEFLWELVANGLARPGYVRAVQGLTGYDMDRLAGTIRAPTIVLWGAEDRVVPVRDAEGWKTLIPDAEVAIFERSGHMPMVEETERFDSVLEEFLAGRSI